MTRIEQQALSTIARNLPRIAAALERITTAEERCIKALEGDTKKARERGEGADA